MHLKKIYIQGFKSFANKTEIEFNNDITAIVGPNGSGKSNISDAIRWVLGEQSIKTLRGNKMQDVIFSGTDKRKALGYAEVTITFDNTDKTIPVDYQEIAVTRRMFRSGESEYYLNKNSCRLKDIRELFMDTGIGKDGYSIVGQGRIDEILSTKPEDRRNIFEEAAGIVKYKSKKTEAERRLNKTQENLTRIKDIIAELENQYNNLKDQSDKATIYLQISNKVREIDINLIIRKIDALKNKIDLDIQEKERVQAEIDKINAEKTQNEDRLNLLREKIKTKDMDIDGVQKQKEENLNSLSNNKNELVLLEEKKKFYIKDIDRLTNELEDLNLRLEKLKDEKTQLLETSTIREEELDSYKEDYRNKNIELKKLNEKLKLSEKEIEDGKDKVIEWYNLISDKRSKINSISSFKENISKRIKQIERDIKQLSEEKEKAKDLAKKLEENETIKKEELVEENKSLVNLKLEAEKHTKELDKIYNEINQNKLDLQGKITNYNITKNMEDDYQGYYKSVKNLMLAHKKEEKLKNRIIGIVADLIKVDVKHEKAIEVALGGSLQNVVTKDENDAKYIIDYLRERKLGRVTFLPISTIKGRHINISSSDREKYHILGLGSELATYDSMYRNIIEYLLGRTIVVRNLDDASVVAKRFNYSFKIVTLEGDIMNPGGSMTGGSLPKVNNLLNRKYKLESIKKDINNLSKTQGDLEQKKSDLKSLIEQYSEKIKNQENKIQDINIEIIKLENERNKQNLELNRNDESITKYNDEIRKLNEELISIYSNEEKLKEEVELLNNENNTIKENIEDLMIKFEEEKEIIEKAKKEVTDAKIHINLMENKIINNKEKLESIEKELNNTYSSIEKKKNEVERNKLGIDEISNTIMLKEKEINNLLKDKEEQDNELDLLKKQKDELMNDFYLIQGQLKEINEKINEFEKTRNNWSIKETKHKTQLDNIHLKLLEEYELNYDEAIKLWVELDNIEDAEREVKKLRNEIKKLGTVNLNSIEEFKNVNERLEFITKQHEDLLNAKKDLNKVIQDMESKMKKQFLYNFNIINKKFNEVFCKLFNGGKADLVLEDEEDILECGIEIKVQPPGKKLQNLNLLSGGEKSLTAVALLFAVIKVKPAPFCILDEIDAALDEANIGKYTNYLVGLADDTQFIMITHRKSTMEIADALYGVTMEEDGISKIVSVKLSDNAEVIAS